MVQTDGYVFLDDGVINDHYAMEHCKTLESIDQGFGKIYLLFMKFWDLYSSPTLLSDQISDTIR
jgi:hypothetical protein